MGPIWNKIYDDAVTPYMEKSMKSAEALEVATTYMKDFHDESNPSGRCSILPRDFSARSDDSKSIAPEYCGSFFYIE